MRTRFQGQNSPAWRSFRNLAPPFLHETDRGTVSGSQRLESAEREPVVAETNADWFVEAQQFAFLGRVAYGLERQNGVTGTGRPDVRQLQDAIPRRLRALVGRTQALATATAEIDAGIHGKY